MIKFLYKDPIHLPEDTPTDHDLSKTLVEDFEDWLSQHQRHKLRPFTKHDPTDLDLYKDQKVKYVKLNTMHDLTTPKYAGKIILLLVYGDPHQCGVACSQVILFLAYQKRRWLGRTRWQQALYFPASHSCAQTCTGTRLTTTSCSVQNSRSSSLLMPTI